MRFALSPCALAVASVIACLYTGAAGAETFSTLPPPPALHTSGGAQQYMLELVVNEQERGDIVPVEWRNGDFWVRAGDLQRAGIPAEKLAAPQVNLSRLAEVRVQYDDRGQRLLVTVPPAWLPGQTIAHRQGEPRYPGRTSSGALLNYDFYATRTDNVGSRLSAWNELRLFGQGGQFSSNGVWQQQLEGETSAQQDGYIRYDSWWSSENENQILS